MVFPGKRIGLHFGVLFVSFFRYIMEALDRILVVLTHELLGGEPPKLVVSKVVSFAGAAVRELVSFNIWVCLPC